MPSTELSKPKILAYGLPGRPTSVGSRELKYKDYHLWDFPISSGESFLDFDMVIVAAGAFEESGRSSRGGTPELVYKKEDLDLKERQFHTFVRQGKPFVFLVPELQHKDLRPTSDLFRRVLKDFQIEWLCMERPVASLESSIPEFNQFFEKHGSAQVAYQKPDQTNLDTFIIAGRPTVYYAFEIARTIFFLPCPLTTNHDTAIKQARDAAEAVLAYRERISEDIPDWVHEFQFDAEAALAVEEGKLAKSLSGVHDQQKIYHDRKALLCLRSEPLRKRVLHLLEHDFGLRLSDKDENIEDGLILDEGDKVLAVLEVKGVSRNFQRSDINQVDDHRERLHLPLSISGVLVMNTMNKATCLEDKNIEPHHEQIEQAVVDNTLIIRTLDLLRYWNLVEREVCTRADFFQIVTSQKGWLRVTDTDATVVTS